MPNYVARIKNPAPIPSGADDAAFEAYPFMVDANVEADTYGCEPSGTLTFFKSEALGGRMRPFMSFPKGEWFAVMELVPMAPTGDENVG